MFINVLQTYLLPNSVTTSSLYTYRRISESNNYKPQLQTMSQVHHSLESKTELE